MYFQHLQEGKDGELQPLTDCGLYTRDHIRLNRAVLLEWRRLRRRVSAEVAILEEIVTKLVTTGRERCHQQEQG
jgi:hypothetical protein